MLDSRRADLLQLEIKEEGQKLVAQRLAVSRRKPGKDIPTIVEVSKNLFLLCLQRKFLLAKAGESINK